MKSLSLTIILLFNSISFAQENSVNIYGKVIDKLTKQPLPGANVLVLNTNLGASTDLSGKFEIKNLAPGEYLLRASIIGYKSVTKSGIMVMSGFPSEVLSDDAHR